ncbi:MAG: GNAT family N-acetyltransferase [Desulfovibrio sp.]|nr:MAG: GNAT family N-acetyltransferase [Desulfovibrio sp.]
MSDYTIRTMSRQEVDWAVDMAAGEGWNPGLHDADSFHAQDPSGFLVGVLDGKPIGCISAISYENTFGFIGFYIVAKEMRGKGYGMPLWHAAMDKLKGHVIGLDGVVEQQGNYTKSGFVFQYSNIRFEHRTGDNSRTKEKPAITRPLSDADTPVIAAYEHDLFPAARNAFLEKWLVQPGALALAAIDRFALAGYGVIRPCRAGWKIGPLAADSPEIAEDLFLELCSHAKPGDAVYLDVPEINPQGMALAEKYGMKKVFGTARMYTGQAPQLSLGKIFGVTTFELG